MNVRISKGNLQKFPQKTDTSGTVCGEETGCLSVIDNDFS